MNYSQPQPQPQRIETKHFHRFNEEEEDLFLAQNSLAKLESEGWAIDMNTQGKIFFRHKETRDVRSIPLWARELIQQAEKRERENIQRQMQLAMGIDIVKSCPVT